MTADDAIAPKGEGLRPVLMPAEGRANSRARLRRVGPRVGPPGMAPISTETLARPDAYALRRAASPTALFATNDQPVLSSIGPAPDPHPLHVGGRGGRPLPRAGGGNGRSALAADGQNWPKMARNGRIWQKLAKNGQNWQRFGTDLVKVRCRLATRFAGSPFVQGLAATVTDEHAPRAPNRAVSGADGCLCPPSTRGGPSPISRLTSSVQE